MELTEVGCEIEHSFEKIFFRDIVLIICQLRLIRPIYEYLPKLKFKRKAQMRFPALFLFAVFHMLVDLKCKKTSEHKKKRYLRF